MKRNPWPYAITGYFILFTTGVVTWVVYATRHQDQLTRPDYYEQEIRYQQHIDTLSRTAGECNDSSVNSGAELNRWGGRCAVANGVEPPPTGPPTLRSRSAA